MYQLVNSMFKIVYDLYISNGYLPCEALNEASKFFNTLIKQN
jgi:hypothetical protein